MLADGIEMWLFPEDLYQSESEPEELETGHTRRPETLQQEGLRRTSSLDLAEGPGAVFWFGTLNGPCLAL